jgi:hypothetical protein
MHITQHAHTRMTQRGLSRRLVAALEEELRLARRVHGRGGVAVVDSGDTLITAYNVTTKPRDRQGRRGHGGHSHG